jgi:hypothetical protein
VTGPLPPEVVEEFLKRYRAQRAAAGLPPHIEDEATLQRIAVIVTSNHDQK